jgi:hypothetical protein
MTSGTRAVSFFCIGIYGACGALQAQEEARATVALTVPAGTPLRLYVTKKFPKRKGAAVAAEVIEPVYAFDREVIPAGSEVTGTVAKTPGVRKMERFRSIVHGDFTPLKTSLVEFTTVRVPNGRTIPIRTRETTGLASLYVEPKKPKPGSRPQDANNGPIGAGAPGIKDRVKAQVSARIQSVTDTVRGPDKKERLVDFAMAKLPYRPQYVRKRTRFDAELSGDLAFGSETLARGAMPALGTQPPPDAVVAARLLTAVDSGTAKQGEPVEAMLTQPLFDAGHRLVLPAGTRLKGAVVMTRRARWFHRTGQLRFNFLDMELPPEAAQLRASPSPELHMQAVLQAAEGSGATPVKVDSEGDVRATEPKTRFISPIISLWVANRAGDNDAERVAGGAVNGAARGNVGGRTLGGGLGFGLLGIAISQSSPYVGMAFGYYGLAWSVYSNLVGRGSEVRFDRNAVLQIRFGGRVAAKQSVGGAAGPSAR